MKIREAAKALLIKTGRVKRPTWLYSEKLEMLFDRSLVVSTEEEGVVRHLTYSDILADDWEVVE